MIKIKNDKIEKTVTKGAYENYYKKLGFEIVGEKAKEVVKEKIKDAVIVEPVEKHEFNVEPPQEDDKKDFEAFILNELKTEKEEKAEKVERPKVKKGLK